MASQYETLYGVGLLDDLHNYFPATLYDSGRFQTVGQLLHYVQTCARQRFDLFSFGQRSYLSTHLEAAPSHSHTSSPNAAPVPVRRREGSPGAEARISTHIEIVQDDLGLDNQALSLLNLMNILSGVPQLSRTVPRQPANFLDPVIVRPTAEQIELGSTRMFPPEETVCAICQDGIPVNQMSRKLNACGHSFHINCIDQWFTRDVRCPTCRHDVREPSAPTPTPGEEEGDEDEDEDEGEEVN